MVALGQRLSNGQPQTDTIAALVTLIEPLKKMRKFLRRKTSPLIQDQNLRIKRILRIIAEDPAAFRGMLHTVFQEIHQCFHRPLHISLEFRAAPVRYLYLNPRTV